MTSINEGANLQVQRQYHIACTRSLINYGAPTLIFDGQKASLKVLQNNTNRFILSAPVWARLHNIRLEANLPPLNRTKARNTAITAKILLFRRVFYAFRRTAAEFAIHPEFKGSNTCIKGQIKCIRDLL